LEDKQKSTIFAGMKKKRETAIIIFDHGSKIKDIIAEKQVFFGFLYLHR